MWQNLYNLYQKKVIKHYGALNININQKIEENSLEKNNLFTLKKTGPVLCYLTTKNVKGPYICPEGYFYNQDTGMCEQALCPEGYEWDMIEMSCFCLIRRLLWGRGV